MSSPIGASGFGPCALGTGIAAALGTTTFVCPAVCLASAGSAGLSEGSGTIGTFGGAGARVYKAFATCQPEYSID